MRGRNVLVCSPVNEPKVVDCFNRQDTFCHVEASDVFGKRVILYEHSHQVTSGKKFHDQVQVCWVLERVEELHHPGRIGFCQNVTLGAYVRQLTRLISKERHCVEIRKVIAWSFFNISSFFNVFIA